MFKKPGDWNCPSCGNLNFASRNTCHRCPGKKPTSVSSTSSSGDWNCPSCGNLNFARRNTCRRCPSKKPTSFSSTSSSGSFSSELTNAIFGTSDQIRQGDWKCSHCDNVVFGSKDVCGLCHIGQKPKNHDATPPRQAGDWDCACGELNFGTRMICRKCSQARPDVQDDQTTQAALKAIEKERKRLLDLQKEKQKQTEALKSQAGLDFPSYWSKQSQQSGQLILVPENQVVSIIQELADKTTISAYIGQGRDNRDLNHSSYQILRVFRVENPGLWSKYSQHRQHIQTELATVKRPVFKSHETQHPLLPTEINEQANEIYLWHGTKPNIKEIIQVSGFDERVASNGLFGHGIYFAENFSKSDEYVIPDQNRTCYMFLSRVSMGNIADIKQGQGNRKRPPCVKEMIGQCDGVCSHPRHHSLLAGKGPGYYLQKYREFIVYDRNQCYPEYLIEYQRV